MAGLSANTDFDYDGSGDWQTFTIPLGDYVSGFVDNLVFLNDDDANAQAESLFRNVSVYENGTTPPDPDPDPDPAPEPLVIDFTASDIGSFSASQDVVNTTYTYDDTTLTMVGNSWKMLSLDYTVTADTMLTFEFRSGSIGEAQGIGFDTGDQRLIDFYFYLYGTQNGGSVANTDFDYDGSGDWQTFTIPLGDYLNGFIDNLVFLNDDDANAQAESLFRNISIYEDVANTIVDPITGETIDVTEAIGFEPHDHHHEEDGHDDHALDDLFAAHWQGSQMEELILEPVIA